VQIVYLSARPALLAGTIESIRAHLGFIKKVLVVVPQRLRSEVEQLDVGVLTDEDLLGGTSPTDHQRRNWALRSALAQNSVVDDVFLMSDDDSRPLVDLEETSFVREGRFRRYTFGWLDDWPHRSTSFDLGQQTTRQILGLYGFPRQAYASHMPQVVVKSLLAELAELMSKASKHGPLCEWTSYFNVMPTIYPDRFHQPEPYVTLGWPENLASWQPTIEPGAFLFENYFREHYLQGAVFGDIGPDDHSIEASIEKVIRWRHYELEVLAGEREPIIGTAPPSTATGRSLRRVRAVVVGDPLIRERMQRATLAATLRAIHRI
jgi:hypothetical protein